MSEDQATINAVAIKLPPVWTSNIVSWFVQAEAQFGLRKITDDITKVLAHGGCPG
jgi:hypothetical protein